MLTLHSRRKRHRPLDISPHAPRDILEGALVDGIFMDVRFANPEELDFDLRVLLFMTIERKSATLF